MPIPITYRYLPTLLPTHTFAYLKLPLFQQAFSPNFGIPRSWRTRILPGCCLVASCAVLQEDCPILLEACWFLFSLPTYLPTCLRTLCGQEGQKFFLTLDMHSSPGQACLHYSPSLLGDGPVDTLPGPQPSSVFCLPTSLTFLALPAQVGSDLQTVTTYPCLCLACWT